MRRSLSTTLHEGKPIVLLHLLVIGVILLSSQLSGCSLQARPLLKAQESTRPTGSPPNRAEASRSADKIEAICIYTIADGQSFQHVLSEQDLTKNHRLEVTGYVNGIVVLGSPGLAISINGRQADRAPREADGSFDIKNFGRLHPEEMIPSGRTYYGMGPFQRTTGAREEPTFDAYSFFPTIVADSVSERDDFLVTIASKDQTLNLMIHQSGHKTLCTVGGDRGGTDGAIAFRYLGSRPGYVREECPDFQARIEAIGEGIELVDVSFGVELMKSVNIIDYEPVYDAVTCDEENKMWLYIETFLSEPVAELKTIASHEALHKYVNLRGFTRDPGMRRLFADLKGHDRNVGSSQDSRGSSASRLFFSFIDEKNFLQGMNGGHSEDDLDEFCTSLLHSLLYSDRLQQNLELPLKIGEETDRSLSLTDAERHLMARIYVRAIQALIQADRRSTPSVALQSFLDKRLKQAQAIAERAMAHLQPQPPSAKACAAKILPSKAKIPPPDTASGKSSPSGFEVFRIIGE